MLKPNIIRCSKVCECLRAVYGILKPPGSLLLLTVLRRVAVILTVCYFEQAFYVVFRILLF